MECLCTHCPVNDSVECVKFTDTVRCKCTCSVDEHIWYHFLNINKTQIFQSTDLKLCGDTMHRFKLMCLKFGANTRKSMEVIKNFDMLLFCVTLYVLGFFERNASKLEKSVAMQNVSPFTERRASTCVELKGT